MAFQKVSRSKDTMVRRHDGVPFVSLKFLPGGTRVFKDHEIIKFTYTSGKTFKSLKKEGDAKKKEIDSIECEFHDTEHSLLNLLYPDKQTFGKGIEVKVVYGYTGKFRNFSATKTFILKTAYPIYKTGQPTITKVILHSFDLVLSGIYTTGLQFLYNEFKTDSEIVRKILSENKLSTSDIQDSKDRKVLYSGDDRSLNRQFQAGQNLKDVLEKLADENSVIFEVQGDRIFWGETLEQKRARSFQTRFDYGLGRILSFTPIPDLSSEEGKHPDQDSIF